MVKINRCCEMIAFKFVCLHLSKDDTGIVPAETE